MGRSRMRNRCRAPLKMLNLLFAAFLIFGILWVAKKFYFPTAIAQDPERFPVKSESSFSKKDMGIILSHLQRWKKEGKISREEYDHLTDLCLSEMQEFPLKE